MSDQLLISLIVTVVWVSFMSFFVGHIHGYNEAYKEIRRGDN